VINSYCSFIVFLLLNLICFSSLVLAEEIVEFEKTYTPKRRFSRNQRVDTKSKNISDELEQESKEFKKIDNYDSSIDLDVRQRLEETFQAEPSIAETQRAAERYMAIPSSEEFRRYRTQARLRNLLPSISGDGDFTKQRYGSYTQTTPNPGVAASSASNLLTYSNQDYSRTGYRTRGFGFDSQWNLNKLIYDDEITDILSEQRRFIPIKSDINDQVHRAYYDRRNKISVSLLKPPKKESERVLIEMEIEELTAKLDSLTGGWFSSQTRNRGEGYPIETNSKPNVSKTNLLQSDNINQVDKKTEFTNQDFELETDFDFSIELEADPIIESKKE
jgi:hypothetical protein